MKNLILDFSKSFNTLLFQKAPNITQVISVVGLLVLLTVYYKKDQPETIDIQKKHLIQNKDSQLFKPKKANKYLALNSYSTSISSLDTDNDGVVDSLDLDDDNDGIPDIAECLNLSLNMTPNGYAYDLLQATFHGVIAKTEEGYTAHGTPYGPNGNTVLTPTPITPENGYAYSGELLLATTGSTASQVILLTTNGLFTFGGIGQVVPEIYTSSAAVDSVEIGLPQGVNPNEISLMTASSQNLVLLTKMGDVWALGNTHGAYGDGTSYADVQWHKANTSTQIAFLRTIQGHIFAVDVNGDFYTWGESTFLGNGSSATARYTPTIMTNPLPSDVQMVQIALTGKPTAPTYLILADDGKIYCLGGNTSGVLGLGHTIPQKSWKTVQNPNNTGDLLEVDFISAADNDIIYPTVSAILKDGSLLNWGTNSGEMLGITGNIATLPNIPIGTEERVHLYVENGGHITPATTAGFYCNAGHNGGGAYGDGTTISIPTYQCNPLIQQIIATRKLSTCDDDGDGVPNHLDNDSDNDGCSDAIEANHGVTDFSATTVGQNGLVDAVETTPESGDLNYEVPTFITLDSLINLCSDSDNDGISDLIDIDDDNDGVPDLTESNCTVASATTDIISSDARLVTGTLFDNNAILTYTLNWTSLEETIIPTNIEATDEGLHYKVSDSATNGDYTTHLRIVNDAVEARIGKIEWGPNLINSSNVTTTNGAQSIDLNWQSNIIKATVFDPDNQLDIAHGTLISTGQSIIQTMEHSNINPATWKIIFNVNFGNIDFDFNSTHSSTTGDLSDEGYSIVLSICTPIDTDNDGILNSLDLDSDGDSCYDLIEASAGVIEDSTQVAPFGVNGLADILETSTDAGIINYESTYSTNSLDNTAISCVAIDSDNDGVSDDDEINLYNTDPLNPDTDNDGYDDGEEITGIDNINTFLNPNNNTSDPLNPCDPDGTAGGTSYAPIAFAGSDTLIYIPSNSIPLNTLPNVPSSAHGHILWTSSDANGFFDDSTSLTPTYFFNSSSPGLISLTLTVEGNTICHEGQVVTSNVIINYSEPPADPLICFELIEASLDTNCEAWITPEMLVAEPIIDDNSVYEITIQTEEGIPVINPISAEYIGETLIATIIDIDYGSTCSSQLLVQNNNTPTTMTSPPDVTIDCSLYSATIAAGFAVGNYAPLEELGSMQSSGNCIADIDYQVHTDIDACSAGTITRTWTSVDGINNQVITCTQVITVEHSSDWSVQFPADTEAACLSSEASAYGEPSIFGDECELIAKSYEDLIYAVVDDACYKVIRTWQVINWCTFEGYANADISDPQLGPRTYQDGGDGFVEYVQIIRIIDNQAPVFTIPSIDGCILEACSKGITLPIPIDINECSNNYEVSITGTFGEFNNIQSAIVISDASPGDYNVHYTVTDQCGNASYESINVTILDCLKPVPLCIGQFVVDIGQAQAVILTTADLNAGSYDNCTTEDDLKLYFNNDPTLTTLTFDCSQVGTQSLELWVEDEAGNKEFLATQIEVQDNLFVCSEMAIAGTINTMLDEPVEFTEITINGTSISQSFTSTDGTFGFSNTQLGGNYTTIPYNDTAPLNGVTTYDLILISKHILDVQPFSSPYIKIAADANNSGTITTADMIALRKLILFVETDFQNNTSWRFIDKDYEFPDPQNPWAEEFPEVISYTNLSQSKLNTDFVAIKVGDVNGSAQANSSSNADQRTNGALQLKAKDAYLKAGEVHQLAINTPDLINLEGFQMTIEVSNSLGLLGIDDAILSTSNFGLAHIADGLITMSWNKTDKIVSDLDLIKLSFIAQEDIQFSEAIRISHKYTKAESYGTNGKHYGISLDWISEEVLAFEIFQNQPNPFDSATTIGFNLPNSDEVMLTIRDISGHIILNEIGHFDSGFNLIKIVVPDVAQGVYYYTVSTSSNTQTKAMVIKK